MMVVNNNNMLGIIVASIVGAIGGIDAYAADDITMTVGETKWVKLERGAYNIKSSDPNIVSIEGIRTHAGFTEVKLKCNNAGTATISYTTLLDPNKKLSITVTCSSNAIPETPIGLISLLAGSFAALYIFTRIKGIAR